MGNNDKIDEAARKGEALVLDALIKADKLLVKTATLRYEVNKLKKELAGNTALAAKKTGYLVSRASIAITSKAEQANDCHTDTDCRRSHFSDGTAGR